MILGVGLMFSASLWWRWRFYSIILSYVCMSCLSLATKGVTSKFWDFKHQPPGQCWYIFGSCWYFFVHYFITAPIHQVLKWSEEPIYWEQSKDWSTFHYVERTGRWDWEYYFLRVDVPANYLGKKGWVWDEASHPETERLALTFQWEHTKRACLFLCVHIWRAPKY